MKPEFGQPLPIVASPETVAFLERRRSASALNLSAPGPDEATLERLLTIAARAPDHGKLHPWRFVVMRGEAKAAFTAGLDAIAAARPDSVKASAKLGKIKAPPLTIAVISKVAPGEIDPWEQELSAGAVCTLMIVAAQALGFGANWITDWYAYDGAALRLLGCEPDERVAGYVHIGTPTEPPLERVRPALAEVLEVWKTDARA